MCFRHAIYTCLVLLSCVVTTTKGLAFEAASIRSETTFEFLEDEFDYMLDPSKLAGQQGANYEGHRLVEGFSGYRFFSNLANQAGLDAYQIGGIIPAGPGNIGLLFDYQASSSHDETGESRGNISTGDGTILQDSKESETIASKAKEWDLYFGYGIVIPQTRLSIGASYYHGKNSDRKKVHRLSSSTEEERALSPAGSSIDTEESVDSVDDNSENSSHVLDLECRYNQVPFDSLVSLSWQIFKGDDTITFDDRAVRMEKYSGGNSWQREERESGVGIDYLPEGFVFRDHGSRGKGEEWAINTENIFELGKIFAVGLDLSYGQSNSRDDLEATVSGFTSESSTDSSGRASLDEQFEKKTLDLSGDADSHDFHTRFEVRLSLARVKFGLGAVYDKTSRDARYAGPIDYSYRQAVNEGYGPYDADDWILVVDNAVGRGSITSDVEGEILKFPVSTEFSITDQLTGRLGAEFQHATWHSKSDENYSVEATSRKTYGNGFSEVGPYKVHDTVVSKDNRTISKTTLNIGLGYQVTQNLKVDVLWRHSESQTQGDPIERETVSLSEILVGAVLAF